MSEDSDDFGDFVSAPSFKLDKRINIQKIDNILDLDPLKSTKNQQTSKEYRVMDDLADLFGTVQVDKSSSSLNLSSSLADLDFHSKPAIKASYDDEFGEFMNSPVRSVDLTVLLKEICSYFIICRSIFNEMKTLSLTSYHEILESSKMKQYQLGLCEIYKIFERLKRCKLDETEAITCAMIEEEIENLKGVDDNFRFLFKPSEADSYGNAKCFICQASSIESAHVECLNFWNKINT